MQQPPLSSPMSRFLSTLPSNIIGSFTGWKLAVHIVAAVLTLIFVISGFDWFYFRSTRSPELRSWMFPAVIIGQGLPLLLPLLLLLAGIRLEHAKTVRTACAIGQADPHWLVYFLLLQSPHRTQSAASRHHDRYKPYLSIWIFAPWYFLGLAFIAHGRCFRHGGYSTYPVSTKKMAGPRGYHLCALYWRRRFHDHSLVLGLRSRIVHWDSHRNDRRKKLFP